MKTNNSTKNSNGTITFKPTVTIQYSVLLAIALCAVGIVTTVVVALFPPKLVNTIVSQNQVIAQKLDSLKNPDSLLILYGSGTVQSYLESIEVYANDKLKIIPSPSISACTSLGDDVFVRNLFDKIIIMSSTEAKEEDFMVNKKTRPNNNILEVCIGTDVLYLYTTDKKIYKEYGANGIRPDSLIKLLKTPSTKKIYLTSDQSGTWAEYSKLTNKLIDSSYVKDRIKAYNRFTNFAGIDNFILLTRSSYDPLKNKKTPYKITVLDAEGHDKIESLYFYIPVLFDIYDNVSLKENSIIDKFLTQRVGIDIDYSTIHKPAADSIIVIRDRDVYYHKERVSTKK